MPIERSACALYEGSGDPALANYYPVWVDNLAADATLEGSLLSGVVQGAEAVRTIVITIRSLYEYQAHSFAGPYRDNDFLEESVARVRGEPIGCTVMVVRNAAGQAQHIAVGYRPRGSLLLLSRLVGEKLAGLPFAAQFASRGSLLDSTP